MIQAFMKAILYGESMDRPPIWYVQYEVTVCRNHFCWCVNYCEQWDSITSSEPHYIRALFELISLIFRCWVSMFRGSPELVPSLKRILHLCQSSNCWGRGTPSDKTLLPRCKTKEQWRGILLYLWACTTVTSYSCSMGQEPFTTSYLTQWTVKKDSQGHGR